MSSPLLRASIAALLAGPASGAVITVDTIADVIAIDGQCSLREAIIAANTNRSRGGANGECSDGDPDGDSIVFLETLEAAPTITLDSPLPPILDDVAIDGALRTVGMTINGNRATGIAEVDAAGGEGVLRGVSVTNLNFFDGRAPNGAGLMIKPGSDVTLTSVTISGNDATGDSAGEGGGGIFNEGTATLNNVFVLANTASGNSGSGGGIFNRGDMTITGGSISYNGAHRAGGGIEVTADGNITLTGTNLINNFAGPLGFAAPGNGGGLHITGSGTARIVGGTFAGNSAAEEGGGLWNGTGTMTVTDTIITGNVASGDAVGQGGGGIFNAEGNITITRSDFGSNAADGQFGSGGGLLSDGGGLEISDSNFTDNLAHRAGGAITITGGPGGDSSFSIENTTLRRNVASGVSGSSGNGGGLEFNGPGTVTISGGSVEANDANRDGGGLWNGSGTMTIDGTTISGNTASGADADQGGGGIFNNGGTLTITDVTISGNTANGELGSGGGILLDGGTLTISGALVTENTAARAGGGIEITGVNSLASAHLTEVEISGNETGVSQVGTPGNGGGLHVTAGADVTIDGGSVTGNTAAEEGGGLWNSATGTMTITGATIDGNVAQGTEDDQGGGGIFNLGTVTIQSTAIDRNTAFGDDAGEGGGGIFSSGHMTIRDSHIRNNLAIEGLGNGGGILNAEGGILRIADTTISGNEAARAGGGIENFGDMDAAGLQGFENISGINGGLLHISDRGTVRLRRSRAENNEADKEGGGLWVSEGGTAKLDTTVMDGNRADVGGGIFVDAGEGGGARSSKLMLDQSLISRNEARVRGGGILVEDGSVTVQNSTISSNSAPEGGGIFLAPEAQLDLSFVTIADNTAAGMGGGVFNDDGTLAADNSIFAGNEAESGPAILGALDSRDFNIIDDTELATIEGFVIDSFFDVPVLIEGLADNGGPTETHALMTGSPALDAGDNDNGPVQDQRTYGRNDGANDIGAFEANAEPEVVLETSFEN